MISFKQFIAEAFDSSYPIEVIKVTPSFFKFEFKDKDNIKYRSYIHLQQEQLSVDFAVIGNGNEFNMQPTGNSSNALKVYSTIGKAIEQYIKGKSVKYIGFDAASNKTIKVYDGLAKIITRKLGGKITKENATSWNIVLDNNK